MVLLEEPACLSLNRILSCRKGMASHDDRLLRVIPPLRWRWQGLLHLPCLFSQPRHFLHQIPLAAFLTGNLSNASLKPAFEMDVEEGKDFGA